jgi:UPF0716 protein FxsA
MKIFRWLLLAALGTALIELYLLLKIGSAIGALPTLTLIVATAALGAYLLKRQGLATWQRLQESLRRGDIPALEIVEGSILLVGGVLLLMPGFLTDLVGLVCLLPFTREKIARRLLERRFRMTEASGERANRLTVEGEYRRED